MRNLYPRVGSRLRTEPNRNREPLTPSSSSSSSSTPARRRLVSGGTSTFLEMRELNGNPLLMKPAQCNSQDGFLKIQVSHPQVWAFHETDNIANGALEQMRFRKTTSEGETATVGLLAGGMNGTLSFWEVWKVCQHDTWMPEHVWPLEREHEDCKVPVHLFNPPTKTFSSGISCIKMPRDRLITVDGNHCQHALITTLGSDGSGGSVRILKLAKPFDVSRRPSTDWRRLHLHPSTVWQRLHPIASFDCTIWTADCSSNGSRAIVGTNLGAALVDLENGGKSWVWCGESDVLALQFDQSGNIALCGFTDGAIVTVDVRENQGVSSSSLPSGKICPTNPTYTPKSICSLVSLQLYDPYFLASSMDGSINLYDHRQIKKGPVQSYEGQVNSHTRKQLGTDPSEKFLLSGGEDCFTRLWNIKSGKLLFEESFSTSVPLVSCCQSTERQNHMGYSHGQHESWGSWLGSQDKLSYVQWY